jgi:hypothetical protein
MFAAKNLLFAHELPITFDASGAGGTADSTTCSWSHTAAAGAHVWVPFLLAVNETVSSVKFGSSTMTSVTSLGLDNSTSDGVLHLYSLSSAPGGAQTVTITLGTATFIIGTSESYKGVASVGSAATVYGASTALSQSVSLSAGQWAFQVFGGASTSSALLSSLSGGTNRYNNNYQGADGYLDLVTNDTNAASTTFDATGASTTYYAGITVPMNA